MMETITDSIQLNQENFLDRILYTALQGNYQIAIWRKPKENLVEIIINKTDNVKRVSLDLEELPAGFVLHPFADQDDRKAIFIEAQVYINFPLDLEFIDSNNAFIQSSSHPGPGEIKARIRETLKNKNGADKIPLKSTPKEDFIQTVKESIDAVTNGKLYKIVPGKIKNLKLQPKFDVIKTFLRLCKAYPNAFVNFFQVPTVGTWIGASPEILIKTKEDFFYTMSLAGTQKAIGDNPLKNAAWTQKEIEEQALVCRYIVNCFKEIRLREYEEIGPKTVVAGDLLHLKSDFKVNMKATNFPQLGSVMLSLLHPTSAVCGMPRDKALAFLKKHEKFDRSYFAGFMGPINISGESMVVVNLRCARLLAEHALLYAGAGITEDSLPEKEWEETELKCDIIGKFINQA